MNISLLEPESRIKHLFYFFRQGESSIHSVQRPEKRTTWAKFSTRERDDALFFLSRYDTPSLIRLSRDVRHFGKFESTPTGASKAREKPTLWTQGTRTYVASRSRNISSPINTVVRFLGTGRVSNETLINIYVGRLAAKRRKKEADNFSRI